MKINVYIEDATPDMLRRILGEEPVVKKPTPEVTRDEVTREVVETKLTEGKKPRASNKYGIPSHLATTDNKTYQRLWYRCKSRGINYEQALVFEKILTPQNAVGKLQSETPAIIKLDTEVTQVGGSKIMSGVGRVIKIRGDNILVRFGNGMDWMQRKHISVVAKQED